MIVKIREISEIDNLGIPKRILYRFKRNKILAKVHYKNFKIIRIPIDKEEEAYLLHIEDRPPKYYLFIKKGKLEKEIENEIKLLTDPEEAVFVIYGKILDLYSKRIAELNKKLQSERRKIFENKSIDFETIEKILEELEILEDFILVLNSNYNEIIRNTTYLQITNGMIKSIHDSITELFSRAKFIIDMQENYYQKLLNKKIEKLTVLSTIFLPPTLIASIYGMNFQIDVIPHWMHPLGFPIAILMIVLSSAVTYILLRRM